MAHHAMEVLKPYVSGTDTILQRPGRLASR